MEDASKLYGELLRAKILLYHCVLSRRLQKQSKKLARSAIIAADDHHLTLRKTRIPSFLILALLL